MISIYKIIDGELNQMYIQEGDPIPEGWTDVLPTPEPNEGDKQLAALVIENAQLRDELDAQAKATADLTLMIAGLI